MITSEELAVLDDPYSASPKSAIVLSLVYRGLLDRCASNVWRTTAGNEALRVASRKRGSSVPPDSANRLF